MQKNHSIGRQALRHGFYVAASMLLAGPALIGCGDKLYSDPTYSQSNFEAARILLSQQTLVAWDDIKDQLLPNFGALSGANALAQILPISQVATDQLVTTLGAALRAGLPSSTETLTKTTDLATGKVTGTDTVTNSPGTPPAATAPLPSTTLTTLLSVPDDLKKIADDPVLKYQLAAGLIQQVALLDNALKKIELASGRKAFLIGLDLDVQPFKREQPYDVFVDISFYPYQQIFPPEDAPPAVQPIATKATIPAAQYSAAPNAATGKEANPCDYAELPEVMPLLEMDNLEATIHSNTIESVTQLALALQATMQGVGAALDTTYKRDLIRSLLGKDRNSLFTMGKSSVNTLAIRIGALNQVKVEREMQAQSHRIYSLVLIPNDYLKCQDPSLHVVAQSTLMDSKTGAKLETITEAQYRAYVMDALSHYGWQLTPAQLDDYIEPLSMAVAARDFGRFMVVLEQAAVALKLEVPNYAYADTVSTGLRTKRYIHYLADTLWQDLQRVDSSYGLVYEQIHLPATAKAQKVPPQQTILAEDDGKLTKAVIRGTAVIGDFTESPKETTKTLLAASLLVQPSGQAKPDVYLPLKSAGSSDNSLTFSFPSMRELQLTKDILAGAAVSLKLDGQVPAENETKASKWSQTYSVRFKPGPGDEKPARFDLVRSATVIVADPAKGTGEARISLSIEGAARVKVAVQGADWDDQAGDGSLFTQSQTVVLRLSNLVEGTPVMIAATAQDNDGKSLTTKTIQFSVKNGQKVMTQQ